MKLSELVKTAQNKLPLYTHYFSETVKVSEMSSEGKEVTVVTDTPHGLIEGENFMVNGAKVKNRILSLTQRYGLGRIVTEYNHQVTKNSPLRAGDSTHITIKGATEDEYNGTFLIMDIPNSNVIEFSIDKNAPQTATGEPYIEEDCYANYNGRQVVGEVIDECSLKFTLDREPEAEMPFGDIFLKGGVRISGEYSIEHALESYEANGLNELWGFCVLDGANISKSRVNHTDAIATAQLGTDLRAELIQDFNFYVIIPTTSEYCWIDFVDLAQELRKPILKTFHRRKIESGVTDEDCYLAFVGDNPVDTTTKAFMVYQYKFQSTINLQNEDGVDEEFMPAIRQLVMHEKNEYSNENSVEVFTQGEIPDEYINASLEL